jgi:hypothetical protein
MRQYAYHPQQGRLIHSPCQLEYLANDGNDKLIHIPGETVDCYAFPLSIRDGLPYLGMRPCTDVEYESPPHVIITSDRAQVEAVCALLAFSAHCISASGK